MGMAQGVRRLVLLTTRTADWFKARNFMYGGLAHVASGILPEKRRLEIDPARNSELYYKELEEKLDDLAPGKRIGF
jgi:amino-acid N-acetyltransferase